MLTAESVQTVISRHFDLSREEAGCFRVSGPLKTSRSCRVFKGQSDLFPGNIAIKAFFPEKTDEQNLERHFLAQKAYHLKLRGGKLRVPQPIRIINEHRIIVMEWIESPRIREILWRSGFRETLRNDGIRAAGKWLRAFHDAGGISSQAIDIHRILSRTEIMMKRVKDCGYPIETDTVFMRCHRLLRDAVPFLKNVKLPHAVVHGDFTPSNIFHGAKDTVGFDFMATERAPVTHDICRFLLYLQVYRYFLLTFAPSRALRRFNEDSTVFLSSYGMLEWLPRSRELMYLQMAELLRRWASVQSQLKSCVRQPFQLIELTRFRNLAKQFIKRIG